MKNNLSTLMLIILIVALFILSIQLLYKNRQISQKFHTQIEERNQLINQTNTFIDNMKESILFQQSSEGAPCNNIEIKNSNNKSIKIKNLLTAQKPLLFLRIKESACDACIKSTVKQLIKLATDFPEYSIAILGGYENTRHFNAFAQRYKDHFSIYNLNSLPIAVDNQEHPYFFVVTDELKIQNIFIVVDVYSQFTSEYLHCMGHKYWNLHIGNHKQHTYPLLYE